ncbi:hypothetical protein NFJ02_28g65860 [Pycnococcus provasolii]
MGACTVRSERDAMAERAEREDEHDGASAQDARPSLRGVAARAEGRQARTLEHTERSANAGMVERGNEGEVFVAEELHDPKWIASPGLSP